MAALSVLTASCPDLTALPDVIPEALLLASVVANWLVEDVLLPAAE